MPTELWSLSRDSAGLRAGRSVFWDPISGGAGNFLLFTTVSRTALAPTQPPTQWVLEALSLGVKRSRREADHSPPFSDKVK